MKKKNFAWACTIISLGTFLVPGSLFAYHNSNYDQNMCDYCHPGGPGGGNFPDCIQCHTATTPPYNPQLALRMENHSNYNLGTNYSHMDTWNLDGVSGLYELTCINCHQPHHHNGITTEGVANTDYYLARIYAMITDRTNGVTTATFGNLTVYDQAWADPATWSEKTSAERGLVLLNVINGDTFKYKVLSATEDTITYIDDREFNVSGYMYLVYGQFIREDVGWFNKRTGGKLNTEFIPPANSVTFGGPRDMGNDQSGTGTDSTPDGICQVCHTQTTHWLSDGSGANHFSGWRCTLCHPHEQGFKADPPPLCP